MEKLLNNLIKKGWKPRENKTEIGKFIVRKRGRSIEKPQSQYMIYFYDKNDYCFMSYSLRELVSKESGLWQFVCENGMVNNEKLTHTRISQVEWGLDVNCVRKTTSSNYEYRLIESSLRDESELEDFLLDNIKI